MITNIIKKKKKITAKNIRIWKVVLFIALKLFGLNDQSTGRIIISFFEFMKVDNEQW